MKKIRLIELFAGYGSQALALKRLGLDFEHYKVVEFDKYAVRSYNAIHNTNFEPLDIRDIHGKDLAITETDKYNYLMTYSFPCTDLSLAGKQAGMTRGSGTRSGLLWEVERILKELSEGAQKLSLPQFLLMENVPQVHSEQNIKDFGEWISFLDSLGYISKWQDLNAKDYGVAQNRERCFMVSYLDRSIKYAFPKPIKLEKTAKDYLEDSVDEKYYIKTEKAKDLIRKLLLDSDLKDKQNVVDLSTNDPKTKTLSNCIRAGQRGIDKRDNKETGVLEKFIVEERTDEGIRFFNDNVCGTLRTIDSCGDKRVLEGCIKVGEMDIKHELASRVYSTLGVSPAITTNKGYEPNFLIEYRIRKLTPLECFRLMDISDSDAKKMLAVNSETQCYKQAGNSIVVAVMVAIFNNLFLGGSEKEQAQIDIFDLLN